MTTIWKRVTMSAVVTTQLWSLPVLSAIPRGYMQLNGSTKPYAIQQNDQAAIVPMESLNTIKSEDIAKVIPCDMAPTDSGGRVASQILDHTLNNLFKSSALRNSDFGRSAQQLESAMSMEQNLSFGNEEVGATKHVVKFKMKPVQTRAQIDYTGLVNAQLSYQIQHSRVALEISERLAANTDLVLSHTDSRDDRREMVSLRWNW